MRDRTWPALEKLKPQVPNDRSLQEIFGLQLQLANSQWFTAETLAHYQLDRLKTLAQFAAREAPFWRERVSPEKLDHTSTLSEALGALPILTRLEARDHYTDLCAKTLPPGHEPDGERNTSGSSGLPVRLQTTNVAMAWQNALNFRAHLWAGRDFSRRYAVIRRMDKSVATYPNGGEQSRWEGPAIFPFPTGPGFFLNAFTTSIEQHWDWLSRVAPDYLLAPPSLVRGLAEMAAEKGRLPCKLKGISTVAEMVDTELRNLASRHLGAEIHDVYSSTEGGVMAIQCPDKRHYHVQSESVIVEILDEENRPCRPGANGRVVITPLFNFATPLLRYELGDYAEVGGACACGRGLPVLNRIMGRRRNLLTLPDGRRIWPAFTAKSMQKLVRIRRHRFLQTAPDTMEVLLVTDDPIGPELEEELRKIVVQALPAPLTIIVRRVEDIPQPENGKYKEFISLVQ